MHLRQKWKHLLNEMEFLISQNFCEVCESKGYRVGNTNVGFKIKLTQKGNGCSESDYHHGNHIGPLLGPYMPVAMPYTP